MPRKAKFREVDYMVLLYLVALAVSMSVVTALVFFAPGLISMALCYLAEHKLVLAVVVLAAVICLVVKLTT